uniref:CSON011036 protein n=1 Tax=Culicoides sonorensis TaxID=179676 RepID=A0A336KTG0_CULSO
MVLGTEWTQVEVIDLINDGNGLGFMLVGGKSTGVVIKALIPGGLAERDGRLQSGDHVLQIGDVNLRGFSSEQVASVLRQCGHQVRLVVARPVEPGSVDFQTMAPHAPIIPTKLLTDPEELDRTLLQTTAFSAGFTTQGNEVLTSDVIPTHIEVVAVNNAINVENHGMSLPIVAPMNSVLTQSLAQVQLVSGLGETTLSPETVINNYNDDTPETETYEVELHKNVYGLGITVAGYVCEEEDLSGIFVKSIIEGSAAEMSRMIQINDRIVAVDGKSLSGVTNHQAVEILRNTDIVVKLTLERFLRGRKYEHLQVALTDNNGHPNKNTSNNNSMPPSPSITTLSMCPAVVDGDSIITEGADYVSKVIEPDIVSCTTIDSNIFGIKENGDFRNGCNNLDNISKRSTPTPLAEAPTTIVTPAPPSDPIISEWRTKISDGSQIVTCEVSKLAGLGISLEGTVEVEAGVELRPHHYIRSILPEGPVGKDGQLRPGDELLQVNEFKLQGLKHTEVVKILRDLPSKVKVVCARGHVSSVIDTNNDPEAFETRNILPGGLQSLTGLLTKAQSESSIYTSSTATITDQQRSKSVEQVSGLALWSTDIVYVNIEKTDRGFGFSILDYQDPLDTDGTVIVVRGLIPGGAAESTGLIFPGDRLMYVNEHNLQGATLDEAVTILKGIPTGTARIGLCRPLSTSDCSSPAETPT